MPDEEDTFLDSVLQEEEAPAEEAEPADPRDAYLPGVVGPRIRQALRGGHGLAGTPRRYGLIVATLVGLASLPTWAVLHTGLSDAAPALSAPTGIVVFTDPAAPPPVQVRAAQPRAPHHYTRGTHPVELAPHPQAAVVRTPAAVRREESTAPVQVPAERPVAHHVARKTPKKKHSARTPKQPARRTTTSIPANSAGDMPPVAQWPIAQWPADTGPVRAHRISAARSLTQLRQRIRAGVDRVRSGSGRADCPPSLDLRSLRGLRGLR
ncbi:hypothetical protein [Hamadaea tsunoensis]|uniref:hypothetical protein n=1 Tax=Hamadaea tsunoensis TaxID=53368 RepID=UPI0004183ABF|nr:hypothetical protein [Hamadaea tsunoensis]